MTVTVCAKQEDTTALLAKVLDGDTMAASLLAEAIHQKLQLRDELAEKLQLPLKPEDLAIWIDPIGMKKSTVTTEEQTRVKRSSLIVIILHDVHWVQVQLNLSVIVLILVLLCRWNQSVYSGEGAGGSRRRVLLLRSSLCTCSYRRLPACNRRTRDGGHQSAVYTQRPNQQEASITRYH